VRHFVHFCEVRQPVERKLVHWLLQLYKKRSNRFGGFLFFVLKFCPYAKDGNRPTDRQTDKQKADMTRNAA